MSARSPIIRGPSAIGDSLTEAMDIDGLERLLRGIESGAVRITARDLTQPSPLALEVLTARPYAYLDDAPLEERRTQAVMARRWLSPQQASDVGRPILRPSRGCGPKLGLRRKMPTNCTMPWSGSAF